MQILPNPHKRRNVLSFPKHSIGILLCLTSLVVALGACSKKEETKGPQLIVQQYFELWNQKTKVDEMLGLFNPDTLGEGEKAKKFRSRLFLMVQRYEITSFDLGKTVTKGNEAFINVKKIMRLGGHLSQSAPEDFKEETIFKLDKIDGNWLITDMNYDGPMPEGSDQ